MICATGALFAFRTPILTAFGEYMVVHDSLQPSDIIFVLNGDVATRPYQVAKLVKQHLADKVVIARAENSIAAEMGLAQNVTDTSVSVMKRAGVPEEMIVQLPFGRGVTSTFEEAMALRDYAQKTGLHRAIVVTSAIHTRRGRWIIQRELAGARVEILMSPAPDPRYTSSNWWRQEDGLIGYQNEFIKLLYYRYKYR